MREMLLDLIRHVDSVGYFKVGKFVGDDKETKFESMDHDRTIILNANLKQQYDELRGEFGMQRFSILQGFLNFPSYRTENSNIDIKYRETPKGTAPEELIFNGDSGQKSTYRFMSADLVPVLGKFIGTNWDVEFKPSRSKVQEFVQFSSILGSFEKWFLATTQNGSLKFFIGDEDATTDRSVITIEDVVSGELTGDLYFNTNMVSTIWKLGCDEDMEVKISNRGALRIVMNTPIAEYTYTIPALHR